MSKLHFDITETQSSEPIQEIDWHILELPMQDDWNETEETKYKKPIIDWSKFNLEAELKTP